MVQRVFHIVFHTRFILVSYLEVASRTHHALVGDHVKAFEQVASGLQAGLKLVSERFQIGLR